MNDFLNKRILLTGATSGIGKSLFLKLIKEGAQIAFCGRSYDKANQLLSEIEPAQRQKIHHAIFDLTDTTQLYTFIDSAYQKFEHFDFVINCAGLNAAKSQVVDIIPVDLDYMMAVNFRAPLVIMQEAGKRMKLRKEGTIVNILSTVCLFSNENAGAYTASKSALDAITKVFNKEMREFNVRVVSIYPGGTDTEFRANKRPDYLHPNEVAEIIIANLKVAHRASLDEIVFRPMVEKNFR